VIDTTKNLKDWFQDQVRGRDDDQLVLSPEFRATQLEALGSNGFPTRKDEEWRYTPLKEVLSRDFGSDETPKIKAAQVDELKQVLPEATHLVFIDGKFSQEYSDSVGSGLAEGLHIHTLESLNPTELSRVEDILANVQFTDDTIFQQMALGFCSSGLYIQVDQNIELKLPLHILHLSSSKESVTFSSGVTVVHQQANSKLTIVQQFASSTKSKATTLPLDAILLDEGAQLDLYKLGLESAETDHISNTSAQVGPSASFRAHQYLLGSHLTRSNLEVKFTGSDAEAILRGIYLGKDDQHLDIRTYLDHAHPDCKSDQHFRGVMNDHSRGVFNGMVLVREHAQRTDAQQSNKNLLLSRAARIDTKPQLEIFADDVKCAHGATIGELDDNAIFYLQSRGISKSDAALMLTRAFAAEITDEIQIESLREHIQVAISEQLSKVTSINV